MEAGIRPTIAPHSQAVKLQPAEEGGFMRKMLRVALAAAIATAGTQTHAAWYEAKSKHFIIYSDVDPQDLRDYADKLERFDQAVRMARGMDDPPLTDAGRLRIYSVRTANEWQDLTGGGGLLGQY